MADDFEVKLKEITSRDTRYAGDAYRFVFEALRYTIEEIGVQRHVTGQELLDGIRAYAQKQFGGLARLVLQEWGIQATDDFGEIVFNLVGEGLMGKTDTDSKEDFRERYSFDEAFPIDYAPPQEPPHA